MSGPSYLFELNITLYNKLKKSGAYFNDTDHILNLKGFFDKNLNITEEEKEELIGLSNLSLLTEGEYVRKIYDAGYHNIKDIIKADKAVFKDKSNLAPAEADRLFEKACFQQKLIDNYLSYGKATRTALYAIDTDGDVDTALGAQAYLNSLLTFVTNNLSEGKNQCNQEWLKKNFYQDFSRCVNPEDKVFATISIRQNHLLVEMLKDKLKSVILLPPSLNAEYNKYSQAAYFELLRQLNTSAGEMRKVMMTGKDKLKEDLADRLQLDKLYLDELWFGSELDASATIDTKLKELIGLSSFNPIAQKSSPKIEQWRLIYWQRRLLIETFPKLVFNNYIVLNKDDVTGGFDNSQREKWGKKIYDNIVYAAINKFKKEQISTSLQAPPPRVVAFSALLDKFGLSSDKLRNAYQEHLQNHNVENKLIELKLKQAGLIGLGKLQILVDSQTLPELELDKLGKILSDIVIDNWLIGALSRLSDVCKSIDVMRNAIEEHTLSAQRDYLLTLITKDEVGKDKPAHWFSEKYLVDASASPDWMTTRLDRAIHTLQNILYAARTGRLRKHWPSLHLNGNADWSGLETYSVWRAVETMRCYPENFMLPSLLPQQTKAYHKLIEKSRSLKSLSPSKAEALVYEYIDEYIKECLDFKLGCSCQVNEGDQNLLYIFARSSVDQVIYWTVHDCIKRNNSKSISLDFISTHKRASRVLGCTPIKLENTLKLCLFFISPLYELMVLKFDTKSSTWDGVVTNLPWPDGFSYQRDLGRQNIVFIQLFGNTYKPGIAYVKDNKELCYRLTNDNVTGWTDEVRVMTNQEQQLLAAVQVKPIGKWKKPFAFFFSQRLDQVTSNQMENAVEYIVCYRLLSEVPAVAGVNMIFGEYAFSAEHGKYNLDKNISGVMAISEKGSLSLCDYEYTLDSNLKCNNKIGISFGGVEGCLFEEKFYTFVHIALKLQNSRHYNAALAWFKRVYDYTKPSTESDLLIPIDYNYRCEFINPHHATMRHTAYLRFVLLSITHCFLSYADAEFSRETQESLSLARNLYMAAEDMLDRFLETHPDTIEELLANGFVRGQLRQMSCFDLNNKYRIPVNPLLTTLKRRIEVNLQKLHQGLNVVGMKRSMSSYTLPVIAQNRISQTRQNFLSTSYRYGVLIERARQLAHMASQMESNLLSILEKRDAETYSLLRARQDLHSARANVQLQDMRVREAHDNWRLVDLEKKRTDIEEEYYQDRLYEGLNDMEKESLASMGRARGLEVAAADAHFLAAVLPDSISVGFPPSISASISPSGKAGSVAAGFSSLAGIANTNASILSTKASYERRQQEWRLHHDLACQDQRVSQQRAVIADDQKKISQAEYCIAVIHSEQDAATLEFLAYKFTNAELYDWMSKVLEGVYHYFLQQGAAIARLAAVQLAFQRQEVIPAFVQFDYWDAPKDEYQANTDRHGLTGSARLLQDIQRLDDYAFATDRRKLQLTRTISLSQMAPLEFQRFRESGGIRFRTPMDLFDRDFPGHYLRLIHKVRVSVIGLIPAIDSIKATLKAAGNSRVVVEEGGVFREVVISRLPEEIALTAPRDATGLFELQQTQQDMLLPFESMGVDTSWEFSLPKPANRFNYNGLADVLLTLEYTALSSDDYRTQLVERLNRERKISCERAFSFRRDLPDLWYSLSNVNDDVKNDQIELKISVKPEHFSPNLSNLKTQHIALYFAVQEGVCPQLKVDLGFAPPHIQPTDVTYYSAQLTDGIISTRASSNAPWSPLQNQSPLGVWTLKLEKTQLPLLTKKLRDVFFMMTYEGELPTWDNK